MEDGRPIYSESTTPTLRKGASKATQVTATVDQITAEHVFVMSISN